MYNKVFSSFLFVYLTTTYTSCQRDLSSNSLSKSISLSDLKSDYNEFLSLLKPILIERVSDTPGNAQVRDYLVSKMKSYGWNVDLDTFSSITPYGAKSFTNIIANYPIGKNFYSKSITKDSLVLKNRIIFACHYDSKYFKNFKFTAATDSAVPCALLLDMAKFLMEKTTREQFKNIYRHLQFIFFDGEEAFKDWTSTDSIYGSRHYAQALKSNYNQQAFDSIDLFVLLDLLGAESSRFPNYFPNDQTSNNAYKILAQIENNLRKNNMLYKRTSYYFTDSRGFGQYSQVEDDHKPFLAQNVPILHLIPSPFPSQWHNENDNLQNLNMYNIQDLRIIMKRFLMEVLNNKPKKRSYQEDEF